MKKTRLFSKPITLKSAVIILISLVCAAFMLSYLLRAKHIGNIYANHRTIQDSSTFLYNWLKLGFGNIHGRMLMDVPSFTSPLGGTPYYSYPPGFLAIPYMLCLITGNEGTVSFLQHYTITNHFILALCLALIVLLIWAKSLRRNIVPGIFFAAAAAVAAIFAPGHYYYLSIEYFADYAVLAPVAIIFLLEVVRSYSGKSHSKSIYILQSFFIFFSAFIDFFAYFFIFVIWLVRIFTGEYKSFKKFVTGTMAYVWPMLAAIALFFGYLYYAAGSIAPFFQRYTQRSSASLDFEWIRRMKCWIFNVYGNTLMYALIISALLLALSVIGVFIVKKNKEIYRRVLGFGVIALASPLLNSLVLSEHSFYHDFTVLKYIFPVTILPLAVCPVLLLTIADSLSRKKAVFERSVYAVFAALALFMSVTTYINRDAYFDNLADNKFDFAPQKLIYQISQFEDFVYVTPEQLDMTYPPVYSRKQMHSIRPDAQSMLENAQIIDGSENICILIVLHPEKPLSETPAYISDVTAQMDSVYTDDDFRYYRCDKSRYIEILKELIDSKPR